MKQAPSYYSIIPANIRYDEDLTANEKLMYGEITALASKRGRAWAENSYFAELYGVHKKTVSRWISNLEKKGYIKVKLEFKYNSKQVSKRYLYINDTPIHNNVDRYEQKSGEGIHNNVEEVLNNTSINNTSTTADAGKKIPYKQIIEYLNKKTNKKISYQAEGNKKLIRARWSEGYTLEDFKKVIDNKVDEWYGTNVIFSNGKPAENYLHPSTLFRQSHFDKYLNQVPITKAEKQGANHNYTVDLDELLGGG